MNYDKRVREILEDMEADLGDVIRVENGKLSFEGVLMPRAESSPSDVIVLKLDSGYNIGLEFSEEMRVEKVESSERVETSAEIENVEEVTKVEEPEEKKDVSVLAAGGTIASRVDYRTGAVKPSFTEKDLVSFSPELASIANIEGRQLFQALSENLNPEHWENIAEAVREEVKKGKDGVVIMHGTDTMGYTAAALSFMLENLPIPVVLVGSQRSSDRGSSDAHQNLLCAVKAATTDIAEVMVCMHGSSSDDFCYLHPGTKVRKMHTSRRDAFRTVNAKPFAKVFYGSLDVEVIRDGYRKKDRNRDLNLKPDFEENVGVVKVYPGMDPRVFEEQLKDREGVVIEGTGLGHMPLYSDELSDRNEEIKEKLEDYLEGGGIAVMTSQCLYGRVNMNVYESGVDLQDMGVVGNLADMLPETAYVKLGWLLGNYGKEEAEELILENLRGEISQRSEHGDLDPEFED
ncbi:MAG: Glu-tRNA(Gln) amidotransferase subunit GatD [Candidatus Aenigmatarchaeota archaeon]